MGWIPPNDVIQTASYISGILTPTGVSGGGGSNLEVPPTKQTASVFFRISCAENATKSLWVTFSEKNNITKTTKHTTQIDFQKIEHGSFWNSANIINWDIRKHCLLLFALERTSNQRWWLKHPLSKQYFIKTAWSFLQSIFRAWTTK